MHNTIIFPCCFPSFRHIQRRRRTWKRQYAEKKKALPTTTTTTQMIIWVVLHKQFGPFISFVMLKMLKLNVIYIEQTKKSLFFVSLYCSFIAYSSYLPSPDLWCQTKYYFSIILVVMFLMCVCVCVVPVGEHLPLVFSLLPCGRIPTSIKKDSSEESDRDFLLLFVFLPNMNKMKSFMFMVLSFIVH